MARQPPTTTHRLTTIRHLTKSVVGDIGEKRALLAVSSFVPLVGLIQVNAVGVQFVTMRLIELRVDMFESA